MTGPGPAADSVARRVVDAAMAVHRTLGPGLLESVYEQCLAHELGHRGSAVTRQVVLPVEYRGLRLESGLRLGLIAGDQVTVEVKSVESLLAVHTAQILTYLRLSGMPLGLLINFNVPPLKQGIRRFIRTYPLALFLSWRPWR